MINQISWDLASGKGLHNNGKSSFYTMLNGKTDYFDWAIFNTCFDITRGCLVVSISLVSGMKHRWIHQWFDHSKQRNLRDLPRNFLVCNEGNTCWHGLLSCCIECQRFGIVWNFQAVQFCILGSPSIAISISIGMCWFKVIVNQSVKLNFVWWSAMNSWWCQTLVWVECLLANSGYPSIFVRVYVYAVYIHV